MIILGIDPGLARIGWGVIRYSASHFETLAYGCIETKAGQSPETRLCQIYDGLSTIISRWRPQEMAIEELFFTKNITTGIVVAEARGVILLCARQMGLRIAEYKTGNRGLRKSGKKAGHCDDDDISRAQRSSEAGRHRRRACNRRMPCAYGFFQAFSLL